MKKIKRRKVSLESKTNSVLKTICEPDKEKQKLDFLGSGGTRLNLALSGNASGGWARGRIGNIVGDGSSGKSLLALELAFWCSKFIKNLTPINFTSPKKINIVYNNVEGVMDFPLSKMYGSKFTKNIEWLNSRTIEEMGRDYIQRLNDLKKGHFLLYIIDSWDALGSAEGEKRFNESVAKNKEIEGSYNLEKQKYASAFFAHVCGIMGQKNKDASLLVISQVRTKIGKTFGKKTYRAGGKALDFYTHQVLWIREIEKLAKTKNKEKRVYGIKSHAKVERSKVAKPFRESEFTILYDYGLDDLSSMVDYIWGKNIIKFKKEEYKTTKQFIKYIEENNFENKLIKKTQRKWDSIEKAFEREIDQRKTRYDNSID